MRGKIFVWLGTLSIVLCTATACGTGPTANAQSAQSEPATVRFVQLETGCWVLETKAGRVQPVDLPEEFRVDGLPVNVELRDAPAMMSICQLGPLKRIASIAKR